MSRKHRHAAELFAAKGYDRLATYNAERSRGILHTDAYIKQMAEIQARFDAEHDKIAVANGWLIA